MIGSENTLQGEIQKGTILNQRYRIENLIATGGMGAVYTGTHLKLNKTVAIKLLRPELKTSSSIVERFKREALAATQIGHENIVEVMDLGETPDGSTFIVMEYLDGEDLSYRIKSLGRVEIAGAAEIISEILSPIGAAHACGIVHRDLKPENIFLAKRSRGEIVKILDFGISRMNLGDAETHRLTHTGLVLGTPYYMSPEQARGDMDITGRTDIYAIGVIFYEMLAGKVPCEATNYNKLMFKVITGDYENLRSIRSDIDENLESIVSKAMALNPEDRFATTSEFEEAIKPYCREGFGAWTSSPLTPAPNSHSGATVYPRATDTNAQSKKEHSNAPVSKPRGGWFVAAAILALLGLGGVIIFMLPQKNTKAPVVANENAIETRAEALPKVKPPIQVEKSPPPLPNDIDLNFSIAPTDAQIELNGQIETRRTFSMPRSEQSLFMKVSAPGFETKTRSLSLSQSLDIEVSLVALPVPVQQTKTRPSNKINRQNKKKNHASKNTKTTRKPQEKIVKDSPFGD